VYQKNNSNVQARTFTSSLDTVRFYHRAYQKTNSLILEVSNQFLIEMIYVNNGIKGMLYLLSNGQLSYKETIVFKKLDPSFRPDCKKLLEVLSI
jgi:hypothetical protein